MLACSATVNAQQPLARTLQRLKAHRTATYTDLVTTRFSFQDKPYTDTVRSMVAFMPGEAQTGGYYRLSIPTARDAYDGRNHVKLYLTDSTYELSSEAVTGQNSRTLAYYVKQLEKYQQTPQKLSVLPDTIIRNVRYSHIRYTAFDSLKNKIRTFSHADYIVDKKTDLPVMIRDEFSGQADDGSQFSLSELHAYQNLKFDDTHFPDLSLASVPAGFKLPPPRKPVAWLTQGTPAPELKLYDLKGKELRVSDLKGKTVLLNFTWIGCPHCVGATQMMDALAAQYTGTDVVLASIYPLDDRAAITKYGHKFPSKAPSFTTDKSVREIYPYAGYPAFYLVDKQGQIAQSYSGFYKELKGELTAKIDSMK
ncbi:hypothetical protein GCM10027037_21820 [Mucilaginibacter koreensis]